MPSLVRQSRQQVVNKLASLTAKRGDPFVGSTHARYQNTQHSRSFYGAFRGVSYAAMRPILNRISTEVPRVAAVPIRRKGMKYGESLQKMSKALVSDGFLPDGFSGMRSFESRQRDLRKMMSKALQRTVPRSALILDDHPFLETFCFPNEYHHSMSTMYMLAASILTSGRGMLIWDTGEGTGRSGGAADNMYYIPIDWCEPDLNAGGQFHGWIVRPDGYRDEIPVGRGEFAYFCCPDPADPFGAVSPLRAEARSQEMLTKIDDVNFHGLTNFTNPSYAISIGTGDKSKLARLNKAQRTKLTAMIKEHVSGAIRNRDPLILDSIVNSITPIGTQINDMDFMEGLQTYEKRVLQSFGVSPVIMGQGTSSNRAGSYEAHKLFYNMTVNPLLSDMGQTFTHFIGPNYHTEDYWIVVYFDEARAEDADLQQRRFASVKEHMTPVESRHYAKTGELDFSADEWEGETVFQMTQRLSSQPTSGTVPENETGITPAGGTDSSNRQDDQS